MRLPTWESGPHRWLQDISVQRKPEKRIIPLTMWEPHWDGKSTTFKFNLDNKVLPMIICNFSDEPLTCHAAPSSGQIFSSFCPIYFGLRPNTCIIFGSPISLSCSHADTLVLQICSG